MTPTKYSKRNITIITSLVSQTAAVALFMSDFGTLGGICLIAGLLISALQILVSKNLKELTYGLLVTLAPIPTIFTLISSPFLFFELIFSKGDSSKLIQHLTIVVTSAGVLFFAILLISYPFFLSTSALKLVKSIGKNNKAR